MAVAAAIFYSKYEIKLIERKTFLQVTFWEMTYYLLSKVIFYTPLYPNNES